MDDLEFSAPMHRLRAAAATRRTPVALREQLMKEFDALHAKRRFRPPWAVMAAAAAVMIVALALSLRTIPVSGGAPNAARSSQTEWDLVTGSADGDFVPVPYAAPLAPGESVDVIRTQLDTQALDRMGVNVVVASAASAKVDADVVLGQDGLPRAVRVLQPTQF